MGSSPNARGWLRVTLVVLLALGLWSSQPGKSKAQYGSYYGYRGYGWYPYGWQGYYGPRYGYDYGSYYRPYDYGTYYGPVTTSYSPYWEGYTYGYAPTYAYGYWPSYGAYYGPAWCW
jgi:hypothetical protein